MAVINGHARCEARSVPAVDGWASCERPNTRHSSLSDIDINVKCNGLFPYASPSPCSTLVRLSPNHAGFSPGRVLRNPSLDGIGNCQIPIIFAPRLCY